MLKPHPRGVALPIGFAGGTPGEGRLAAYWAAIRALLVREQESRSGFLWLPVAFGLGILAYFEADREPSLWAGPALAIALSLCVWRLPRIARSVALALLFAALGFSAATFRTADVEAPMLARSGIYEVTGFIETIDPGPLRHRLTIRPLSITGLEPKALPQSIRVGAPGPPTLRPGDAVSFRARLSPPSEAAMPGGYDFRREAYFRQVGASGFALGRINAHQTETVPPMGLRFNAMIDDWRNRLTDRISRVIGGEAGALAAALITGKRGLIPEETNEDLRASGLYHIVSISGLHMVLAAGIFFWIARAGLAATPTIALRWPIKKIAAGIAMVGASFYCVFSGSEVATERSLIMTLVMLGAILVDRPALAMRNLAISALIVLAREPEALLGPSFQMSFAAVACLIAANQVWQDWKSGQVPKTREPGFWQRGTSKLLLAFVGIVATTCVASLATAPFGAWHFHRLNPLGVIGNALAIPLVSLVVMPSAVIGTLLLPFGLDGIVWRIMGEGVRGVLFVAHGVANLDFAVVAVSRASLAAFVLVIAGLLVFTCLRTRLRWSAGLLLIAAIPVAGTAILPDVVTDADGRMVLIRGEGGRYQMLSVGSPSRFTLNQWLPALGDTRRADDPALRTGTRCDRQGCVGRLADGRLVSLVTHLATLREDCARADIIVTPLAAGAACGKSGPRIFDRAHFSAYGATRITTRDAQSWSLLTALDPERQRPWRRTVQPTPPVQ